MTRIRSSGRLFVGLAVAVCWILGVLVLPALHLAFHAVPHDHIGGGIHYHAQEDDPESTIHRHPHLRVDAAALRRASGAALVAPAAFGLAMRSAGEPHDAQGLAHFASAPGEGAGFGTVLPTHALFSPHRDVTARHFTEFFFDSKRLPRPPPSA